MTMRFRWVAGLAASIMLAGCATEKMTPGTCAASDWYAVGFSDGTAGKQMDAVNRISAQCFDLGFQIDTDLYQRGRMDGLVSFCTPQNGFSIGESGGSYNGACAYNDEGLFLASLEEGRERRSFVSAVDSAISALESAENDIDRIDEKITTFEIEISQFDAGVRPNTDVGYNLRRIDELRRERSDILRRRIPDLRADLAIAERELDAYERDFALRQQARAYESRIVEAEARAAEAERELAKREQQKGE